MSANWPKPTLKIKKKRNIYLATALPAPGCRAAAVVLGKKKIRPRTQGPSNPPPSRADTSYLAGWPRTWFPKSRHISFPEEGPAPAHCTDTRHPPAVTRCPSLGTPGGPARLVEVETWCPARTRARTASRKPRAPRAAERVNGQSGSA